MCIFIKEEIRSWGNSNLMLSTRWKFEIHELKSKSPHKSKLGTKTISQIQPKSQDFLLKSNKAQTQIQTIKRLNKT